MKCHLFFPHIHTVALFSTVWSTNTIVGTFAFSANISRADKINGNHSPKIRKLKYEFYRLRRAHAHATNTLHFNAVVCRCANRTLLIILTCTLPSLFITMKAHSTPTHFDVKIGRQKKESIWFWSSVISHTIFFAIPFWLLSLYVKMASIWLHRSLDPSHLYDVCVLHLLKLFHAFNYMFVQYVSVYAPDTNSTFWERDSIKPVKGSRYTVQHTQMTSVFLSSLILHTIETSSKMTVIFFCCHIFLSTVACAGNWNFLFVLNTQAKDIKSE